MPFNHDILTIEFDIPKVKKKIERRGISIYEEYTLLLSVLKPTSIYLP